MPDNKQLIEQLRGMVELLEVGDQLPDHRSDLTKAADTIERLEAELRKARTTCSDCNGSGERPPDGKDSMGLPRWGDEMEDNRDRSCRVCRGSGQVAERERDAAVLGGLLSDVAKEAAFRAAGLKLSSAEPPTPAALGDAVGAALEAALQHAQEQVGEERG